jgi:hypothetical protein
VESTLTQLELLKVLRKALGLGWEALEVCQMEIGLTTVEFLSSTKQQSSLLLIVWRMRRKQQRSSFNFVTFE